YSRQIVLPEIGARGQRRLLDARVGVLGTGAAAEPALIYLGAAGIGHLLTAAALAAVVDPAEGDVTVAVWPSTSAAGDPDIATSAGPPLDALVCVGPEMQPLPVARRRFWIDAGRAAEMP